MFIVLLTTLPQSFTNHSLYRQSLSPRTEEDNIRTNSASQNFTENSGDSGWWLREVPKRKWEGDRTTQQSPPCLMGTSRES